MLEITLDLLGQIKQPAQESLHVRAQHRAIVGRALTVHTRLLVAVEVLLRVQLRGVTRQIHQRQPVCTSGQPSRYSGVLLRLPPVHDQENLSARAPAGAPGTG
jgi:hypothetical protein